LPLSNDAPQGAINNLFSCARRRIPTRGKNC
jgi:hypothetical protein